MLPALFLMQCSCATLVAPSKEVLVFESDKAHKDPLAEGGASIWWEGKPVKVKSYLFKKKSDEGFGEFSATTNRNTKRMAYGQHFVVFRRRLWGPARLEVRKPGYNIQYIELEKKIRTAYWFNVLNFAGFIIDYWTGALWEYSPNKLKLNFVKGDGKQPLEPVL